MPNDAWERLSALALLNEPGMAKHSIVVNISWGTYFIDSLYGPPEKLSISTKGIPSEKELGTLQTMGRALGRSLVFIRRADSQVEAFGLLQQKMPDLRRIYPYEGQPSVWEVWAQERLLLK